MVTFLPIAQGSTDLLVSGFSSFRNGELLNIGTDCYYITNVQYDSSSNISTVTIGTPAYQNYTDASTLSNITVSDIPLYYEGNTEVSTQDSLIIDPLAPGMSLSYNGYALTTKDSSSLRIITDTSNYVFFDAVYSTLGDLSTALTVIPNLQATLYASDWMTNKISPFTNSVISNDSTVTLLLQPDLRLDGAGTNNYSIVNGQLVLNSPLVQGQRYNFDYLGVQPVSEDSTISYSGSYFNLLPAGSRLTASFRYNNLDQFYIQVIGQRDFLDNIIKPKMKEEAVQQSGNVGQGGDIQGDNNQAVSEGGLTGVEYQRADAEIQCHVFNNIFDFFNNRLRSYSDELFASRGWKLCNNDGLLSKSDQSSGTLSVNRMFPWSDYTSFEPFTIACLTGQAIPYAGLGPKLLGPTGIQSFSATGSGGGGGGTGPAGRSGYSGYSGAPGVASASGYSGYSGYSGISGYSGYSGYSGSGYSGYSGLGLSGYSGYSGQVPANVVLKTDSITVLADVDTTSNPPARDVVLKWNGTDWVPATYNYSFAMTIASFISNQTTPQLIGDGTWAAAGAVNFTASYNNPPPKDATITLSSNGGVTWVTPLVLTVPYTDGTNIQSTIYPNDKDKYVSFTLTAHDGTTPRTSTVTINFHDYVYWGPSNKNSGFSAADVKALSGSEITSSFTTSRAINSGVGDYLVIAYPSSYGTISTGQSYEISGNTGFLFNSISCAMKAAETVLISNTADFTENYKVYASYQNDIGSSTLYLSTSSLTINNLYYGKTSKTSGFTAVDIQGLENAPITNNNFQTWNSVTAGAGEYLLFAFPARLGTVYFWVGGFEGGFNDPETVDVTNANGWAENYYAWRSVNSNLGSTVVTTAAI